MRGEDLYNDPDFVRETYRGRGDEDALPPELPGGTTSFGTTLVTSTDAAAGRTALGLGTIATQNSNSVAITGGAVDGTAIGSTTRSTVKGTDVDANAAFKFGGTQVLTGRKTGWTAATGTATRTAFDTTTVTLPELAERLKALLDDLISHGAIGS